MVWIPWTTNKTQNTKLQLKGKMPSYSNFTCAMFYFFQGNRGETALGKLQQRALYYCCQPWHVAFSVVNLCCSNWTCIQISHYFCQYTVSFYLGKTRRKSLKSGASSDEQPSSPDGGNIITLMDHKLLF